MNRERLKSYLEVSTNLTVLIVAIILLSSFAINWFNNRSAREVISGIAKGQQLDANLNIDYRNSSYTLLLALNTRCEHCANNAKFYTEILHVTNNGKKVQAIAVFPNSLDEVRQYCQQHELTMDHRDSVDLSLIRIAATPTLVLIDQTGRVVDFWVGEITGNNQQKLLSYLAALP